MTLDGTTSEQVRPEVVEGGNAVPREVTPEQVRLETVGHHAQLLGTARKLCRNEAEAQDLVQDTFERALRRIDSFIPGTDLRAWLVTILTRLFIDRVRRAKTVQFVELHPDDEQAGVPLPFLPELHVSTEEILAAISQLDDDLRGVIELHDVKGLRYREIAAQIGIPTSTVGTRLMRARARLRALLEAATGVRR